MAKTDSLTILKDRQGHSSVLVVQSFRAADCDNELCMMVTKVRSLRFHMEGFDLRKLNEIEGKEQYCVEVSNRFVVLEDLDTGGN
jgi:hypothetical protein